MKKNDKEQEGHKGGERWDLLCDAFIVFAKQINSLQLYFFILELILVLKFQKKNLGSKIFTEESNSSSKHKFGRFG